MMDQWLNGQQILTYQLIRLANQIYKRSWICFPVFWDNVKVHLGYRGRMIFGITTKAGEQIDNYLPWPKDVELAS